MILRIAEYLAQPVWVSLTGFVLGAIVMALVDWVLGDRGPRPKTFKSLVLGTMCIWVTMGTWLAVIGRVRGI